MDYFKLRITSNYTRFFKLKWFLRVSQISYNNFSINSTRSQFLVWAIHWHCIHLIIGGVILKQGNEFLFLYIVDSNLSIAAGKSNHCTERREAYIDNWYSLIKVRPTHLNLQVYKLQGMLKLPLFQLCSKQSLNSIHHKWLLSNLEGI